MNTPNRQARVPNRGGVGSTLDATLTKEAQRVLRSGQESAYRLGRTHGVMLGWNDGLAVGDSALQFERSQGRLERWLGCATALGFGLAIGAGCMFVVLRQWGAQ